METSTFLTFFYIFDQFANERKSSENGIERWNSVQERILTKIWTEFQLNLDCFQSQPKVANGQAFVLNFCAKIGLRCFG